NIKYPHKKPEVIGLANVTEVINYPELVKKESDTNFEFAKKFIRRNSLAAGIIFSILMLLAGVFAARKILPREFKPLPRADNDMYLIYAPDRDTNWIFNNADYFGEDTIDFGDVAAGDQWFPAIEFINNSRDKEEFNVYVEGQDKDDFQLTWLYSNNQPEVPVTFMQDAPQTLYVRFVPVKPGSRRNAALVFENKKTGSAKKIYLTGVSKRLNKGYCIAMEEVDDALVLEPNTNLLQDNSTVSFWIKPVSLNSLKDCYFLFVDNNPMTNNKLSVCLRNSDTLISFFISGSKSLEIPGTGILTNFKLRFGQWNYFAMSFKDTVMTVVINDSAKLFSINRNSLRKLNDCIFFGLHPSSRTEMLQTFKSEIPFKYYLDEFKIYNTAITSGELIKNRFDINYREGELLAGYDFDDATPKRF
ncbi:MAG: LamG domain-containing protein, partial [Ignavibacteria bacterium]|nr:LamG domain-containing protein [Ignavibacteria bacterium]